MLQPHPLLVWFSRPDPGRQGDPPSPTYPTLPSLAKQARSREGAGKKGLFTSNSLYFQCPAFPGSGLPVVTWAQVTAGRSLAPWSLYAAVSPFPALLGYWANNLSGHGSGRRVVCRLHQPCPETAGEDTGSCGAYLAF